MHPPPTHFLTSARLLLNLMTQCHYWLPCSCTTHFLTSAWQMALPLLTAMLMHPPTHSPQWYLLYNVHTKVFIEWKSKRQASSHYHLWVESQEVVDIEPVLLVITSDHWSAICWSVDLYWPQWAEQAEEWAIVSFSSPTPSSSLSTTSRGSWACAGGYDPPLEIWWEQWLKWLIWSLWHCWYTLATWLFDQLYQSMSERS